MQNGAACFPPDSQFRLSADVGTAEAVHRWQRTISTTFTSLTATLATTENFRPEMRTCELMGLAISGISAQPHIVSRDRSAICHSAPDKYFLVRQISGESEVEFEGGTARMVEGDFAIVDPQIPYRLLFPRSFEQQCVQIPQFWLREQLELTNEPLGNRLLHAGSPMVRMLGLSLDQLIASASEDEATITNLSELFFDILLRTMKGSVPLSSEAGAGGLTIDRIRGFVAHHYADPDLSPSLAAHELGCSLRTLHRICALAGTSFGRVMLDTRLSASHRMLQQQPACAGQISRIALDAGFSDQAYFSRVFKERFGATPRQFSRLH
jgi:AraC family transcriptional regulator, positive regulator of tynA and feaB